MSKVAVDRSRRRGVAARVQLSRARRHGEWRRARADQARLRPRRPGRDPLRQPRRISRGLLRHHARRLRRGAGELQVPAADHPFHHQGFRRQARVLRSAAAQGLPGRSAGRRVRRGGCRKLRCVPRRWSVRRDRPGARRAGDVPLHLGLDRHAQGRRALAPEPHLGGAGAARARARPAPLSDRRAALPHERAGALQARLRRARHHRAAAAVHRARLYRGDRALSRHLAHRGAADDGDDAARDRPDGAHRPLQRGVHPHGLGAGEPEPDAGDPSRAAEGGGDQCLRHHRSRAGGVRPASEGTAAAGNVGRLSASAGAAAPRRRRQPRRRRRACWR